MQPHVELDVLPEDLASAQSGCRGGQECGDDKDEEWEGLVPPAVADVIREIDGVARIKQIATDDGDGRCL